MAGKHANPTLTVRPPVEVYETAKALLGDEGREVRDFVVACLTTLTKEPETMISTVARHWPPPARRGRPTGKTNIIYAFRPIGDTDARWYGDPNALPPGDYETGEIDFQPALANHFRGRLEIRYGPVSTEDDSPPSTFAYTTVNNTRMRPTPAVHELLFGTGTTH